MTKSDKALVLLLRIVGGPAVFALVAVVMPTSWMAATHRWLGLGEMPTGPVVEYLARSLSPSTPSRALFVWWLRLTWSDTGPWCGSSGWPSP